MKTLRIFFNGIFTKNPAFVLMLGLCPLLAVSTSLENAIGMGASTAAVLVCSSLTISLLRKLIPEEIRLVSFAVIIAGYVTVVEMLLAAYFPALRSSLGIFVPLIVVNCLVLSRTEEFFSKNTWYFALTDGLGMGLGFAAALAIVASIREILGSGTILGISLFGAGFEPAAIMIMPPGGFLTLGIVLAVINAIAAGIKGRKNRKERPLCRSGEQ